ERHLPAYLVGRRWFRAKSRRIKAAQIVDAVPVPPPDGGGHAFLAVVSVDYVDGDTELYALPLSAAAWEPTPEQPDPPLPAPLAPSAALAAPACGPAARGALGRRRPCWGGGGRTEPAATPMLRRIADVSAVADPAPVQAEQSNTSIVFGDKLILKLFRRLEPG